MKKTKVISAKNLPTRVPLQFTAIVYLLMDKFNASQLAWGIVGTIIVIFWIVAIIAIFINKSIDIFESTKGN